MKKIAIMILATLATCGCQTNPLLQRWNTPFEVPPFDKIQPEHYVPAMEKAISIHQKEINAITSNTQEPNFENTILAFDNSGELLDRVYQVFSNTEAISYSDQIGSISEEIAPMLSAHESYIMLNDKLFARIKAVWDKRDDMSLDAEQMRLLTNIYKSFSRNGANLDDTAKARLKEVQSQIASLQLKFSQNLIKETASWKLVIDKEEDLAGLSNDFIADAAHRAASEGLQGKWIVGLDNPSVMPFLSSAKNREMRVKVLDAYTNRCNNDNEYDNKAIVAELLRLKLEKAQILGYKTFADYAVEENMSKTPQAVIALLDQVWGPALNTARAELADIEAIAKLDGISTVLPADWRYYFEKARDLNYSFNEDQIVPYFMYENVRSGIFYVANKLFGITFTEINDIPIPHPEAQAFRCDDADGTTLGILYMDMFARPGEKSVGAWCSEYRSQKYQNGKREPAIVTICGNFSRPTDQKPSLLTVDETETFFHEFGHALACLMLDSKYKGLNDFVTDFVELPSQLNEHWAFAPEVLAVYAKHYQTSEVIPQELVDKILSAKRYGSGFAKTELFAAMYLDMAVYMTESIPDDLDIIKFEKKVLSDKGLIDQIPPRYRLPYFLHIFSHGYDAGYYSYLWAEVLDCDVFNAFKSSGDIFNPQIAKDYRSKILARGGSEDALDLYLSFMGHYPDATALIEHYGLKK